MPAREFFFILTVSNIEEIVDDLISIGVDCINPLDPCAIDYREFKKKFGKRYAYLETWI